MAETIILRECPHCKHQGARIMHKDVGFAGQNEFGAKKIRYQSYVMCNRCFAKGPPKTCTYPLDTEEGRTVLAENDRAAATAWNHFDGQAPLTKEELRALSVNPCHIWVRELRSGAILPALLGRSYGVVLNGFAMAIGWVTATQSYHEYDYGSSWLAYTERPLSKEG